MNMQYFEFNMPEDAEVHSCQSYRSGDWVVYTCSQCMKYERRINWRTGEMNVRQAENRHIRHTGAHAPIEYADTFKNVN